MFDTIQYNINNSYCGNKYYNAPPRAELLLYCYCGYEYYNAPPRAITLLLLRKRVL